MDDTSQPPAGLTHRRGGVVDVAAVVLGGAIVGFVLGREVWRQVQGWRDDFPSLPAALLSQIIRDFHNELREWQQVDGPSLIGTRGDVFRVQMGVVENYLERYPELEKHEVELYQALDQACGNVNETRPLPTRCSTHIL